MRALLLLLLLCTRVAAVEGCPLPAADAMDEWEAQHLWTEIEKAGLRIGHIQVEVVDVYESGEAWYAAGMNWLHIETRERVVRDLILIEPGDAVAARVVYDSARRMRDLGIFRQVTIVPLRCHDGVVDVLVRAKDAWTLLVSPSFSRSGGASKSKIKFEDGNFLGSGKELQIEAESDAERSSVNYSYDDQALFGSRWRFYLQYQDQSDGHSSEFKLLRPFLTATQNWGFYSSAEDARETLSFYQFGEVGWHAQSYVRLMTASAWRLLERDADSGWRVGLGVRSEERRYDSLVAIDPTLRPAPDLAPFESQGLTLGISRFHDRFESFTNLKLVDKTEDINLGLDATLEYTLNQRIALDAAWAARWRGSMLLQFELESQARKDDQGWRDGLLNSSFTAYSQSGRHTRLARLAYDWREDPDPEHEATLGGDEGMLGYPAHYLVGDRILHLHLEDRWTTDQVLFQTLRVGYTMVAEAGTGRRIGTKQWSQTLVDVGAGLRLGNLRGAHGEVFYITVFVPLVLEPGVDSWQFVLGHVITF